jgi:Domain of unknown function (DUF397)
MINPPPTFTEGEFRKASRSEPDKQCVHVARRAGWVEVRDTKKVFDAADDHRLVFTAEQFDDVQAAIRAGRSFGHLVQITVNDDGMNVFRSAVFQPGPAMDAALEFSDGELLAFYDGVLAHEFDEAAFAA